MALNLSTLTSPATSGDVLAEALTTADFLEPVPVLRNLARGSQKGGDAKQDVALNQPKALPLIDGDGYLYVSGVAGNYAEVNTPIMPATGDFDLSIDFIFKGPVPNDRVDLFSQYDGNAGRFIMSVTSDNKLRVFWGPVGTKQGGIIVEGQRHTARLVRENADFTLSLDGTSISTWTSSAAITILNSLIGFGHLTNDRYFKGAVFSVTEGSNVNCDFTATNVRHGDTKFKCATGQIVTINTAGNDPSTIIKKSVLRFANTGSTNIGLDGLFSQEFNGGYMFAALSVLGDGGGSYAHVFATNKTGGNSDSNGGVIFSYRPLSATNLGVYRGTLLTHNNLFDSDNGDFIVEHKATNTSSISKVNDADTKTSSLTYTIESDEFKIGKAPVSTNNAAFDLEFLALFPADSVPDEATATKIRDYINKRNNVFSLIDSQGYYFYNAQNAPVGAITTGSSSWNGRIVGSDLGDSDRYLTQGTTNDAPVGDGFKVTFADNTDHLDIPQVTQAGWQVVGTSLGTFAYRVNANAVTELNLLGNLGSTSFRQAGDLYGVILLPESATGKDIEEARKLLIDRGAADGATSNSFFTYWSNRYDIVEFNHINTSSVTSMSNSWFNCQSLSKFPLIDTSSVTSFNYTFYNTNLESFPAIQAPLCTDFRNTWYNCSALTSFPAGAKLGTSAQNVNFTSAWQSSGLTSFPADIDLSKGINFANTWRQSGLTSFPAIQSTLNGRDFFAAWYFCQNLTSFGAANLNASGYFNASWQSCANLEDFPALFTNWNPTSITSGVFNNTWKNCTALTAQSVENILTSIDASGQHATSDGDAYVNGVNTQLADAGIDIDYDGTTLSAATNTAVTSLKSKGWSIIVNNVTL